MKSAVILSEAKDLQFRSGDLMQIVRFAQIDTLSESVARNDVGPQGRMSMIQCTPHPGRSDCKLSTVNC